MLLPLICSEPLIRFLGHSKMPKEQIITDTISCGNIALKVKRINNMNLDPIQIEVKDTITLKEPIYLDGMAKAATDIGWLK